MKAKSDFSSISLQMERARQLLDLGHHREALNLALDVLLQELHHLRHLLAVKNMTQPETGPLEEPAPAVLGWLPEAKPRILH